MCVTAAGISIERHCYVEKQEIQKKREQNLCYSCSSSHTHTHTHAHAHAHAHTHTHTRARAYNTYIARPNSIPIRVCSAIEKALISKCKMLFCQQRYNKTTHSAMLTLLHYESVVYFRYPTSKKITTKHPDMVPNGSFIALTTHTVCTLSTHYNPVIRP